MVQYQCVAHESAFSMAIRSRFRRPVVIPTVTTAKSQTKDYEFKKGLNTNLSNDDVPADNWVYATDVRETQIGKWETRKGSDLWSVPVGEAVNVQENSTTGASDASFSTTSYIAQKLTAASTDRLTAIDINLRKVTGATGTVVVALYSDVSSSPGVELARSTIAAASITTSYQYLKARFASCPDITNTTAYWVVIYAQSGTGTYQVSATTNSTNAKTSTNSGQTWTGQSYSLNAKLYTATASGVKGLIRVKRPNGTYYTFFAHGTSVYSVDEGTGVVTAVDTGLDASSTYCEFSFVSDVLYYVTGLQKPRKYDFTTASEITTAPENAALIIAHKGVLFFISALDVTKMYYTNFAKYDTFTSTDFIYVDAPKTADPVTALARLNGNLYPITRNNKFILYGSQNATFRLDEAPGQKGTFSQKSVVVDQNFMFLASDDGIYRYNGAEEKNISANVLNLWTSLDNKENAVLELHDNRLYVWYTPNGQSYNSECLVYNVLYDIWESLDTKAYVARAYARFETTDKFLQGSNRVGMVVVAEESTNDYNVLGEPLTFELRTNYNHYDSPAQFKRAPLYRPHFDTQSGNYALQVGYAKDYNDSPTYSDVSLQGGGATFNAGYTFNSGVVFGSISQINPLDNSITIPGEWRRLQLRYKHYAAREPVSFDGHVLTIETQRIT